MITAAITLASQTRVVHEARRRLAVARGLASRAPGEEGSLSVALREMTDDAELMLIAEEDTLRALAVAAFHATGQSHVSPGITVDERIMQNGFGERHLVPCVTLADDLGAALDAAGAAQTPETWR